MRQRYARTRRTRVGMHVAPPQQVQSTTKSGPSGTIELLGLTKQFAATVAVDGIDLTIPAGTYCCLLGPSGCGKTSTLRMIAGHETASDGRIHIDGTAVEDLVPAKRGTAMMFQNYALFPHLDARDNVAFSLKMRGIARAERHAQAMQFLRLVAMEE